MTEHNHAEIEFSAAVPDTRPVVPSGGHASDVFDDTEFATLLLMALNRMAARSKRGQADLVAALRGAGLSAPRRRVRAALRLLQAQGAIDNLVPLSDGGLLLTVTNIAPDSASGLSQWWTAEDRPGDDLETVI